MGKLVVDEFDHLDSLSSTCFYRIFGRILKYDTSVGIIQLGSLFDNTSCDIELDFDKPQGDNLTEGLVVDVQVITIISRITNDFILKVTQLNLVDFPQALIDKKEVLIKFSHS